MTSWKEALNFARGAHDRQTDIHGYDYFLHVLRVTASVSRAGVNQPEALAAAALHDTVEDCGITLEVIGDSFGPRVRELVDLLTHRAGETYRAYIERVDTDRVARVVKLADLEDNSLPWRLVPSGRKQRLYTQAIVRLQSGEWPS